MSTAKEEITASGGEDVLDEVKEYYGQVLAGSEDLKTNACTTAGRPPEHVRQALMNVHPEVISKYYGCGFVAPDLLKGLRVLDLGCGAGRDVYVLAQLVGEEGEVVGVDMTDEQLSTARRYQDWHRAKFGYKKGNVKFLQGYIERLNELKTLESESFDLIVSNCVINLSPDKPAVFREAFRLLKPGGELYFSDVYSSQRIPKSLRQDPVLWGECLSGALYWNDFLRISKESGFSDPRLVKDSRITIQNQEIERKVGHIEFYSATYRLWKVTGLELDNEDYGQAVIYKGTIPDTSVGGSDAFLYAVELDSAHRFVTGKVTTVSGNTFSMLKNTRFAPHFDFIGDFSRHYGLFQCCGPSAPFLSANTPSSVDAGSAGGCCAPASTSTASNNSGGGCKTSCC